MTTLNWHAAVTRQCWHPSPRRRKSSLSSKRCTTDHCKWVCGTLSQSLFFDVFLFYEFVTCVLQGTSLCEALHTLNWTEYELSCVLQSKAVITPWVGLRKINVSYWCWEDMSPFTNSTLQWLPGEPSDAGFCGYLAEPTFNGLKAATCVNSVNGSLCERPSEKMHIHTHIDNNK